MRHRQRDSLPGVMRFNAGVSHLRNRHVLPVTAIPVVAPDAFPRWTHSAPSLRDRETI